MEYVIISAVVFGLFFLAMGLGVVLSNKPLKGSCGGLSKIMGEDCQFCENKHKCKRNKQTV